MITIRETTKSNKMNTTFLNNQRTDTFLENEIKRIFNTQSNQNNEDNIFKVFNLINFIFNEDYEVQIKILDNWKVVKYSITNQEQTITYKEITLNILTNNKYNLKIKDINNHRIKSNNKSITNLRTHNYELDTEYSLAY